MKNLPPWIRCLAAVTLPAALLCSAPAALAGGPLLKGPPKTVRAEAAAKAPAHGKEGVPEMMASAPILLYQRVLRAHWGYECAYHPSCSNYALQAIRKHGALVGSLMTFDRLQHEADEARTSPLIVTGGRMKVHDPLENNDYWWYRRVHPGPARPVDGN